MNSHLHLKGFLFITIFLTCSLVAASQEKEEKSPEELAYEQAEKMEKDLKLEPHQTFYVDSVLQHDMRAMYDELTCMKNSGVQEYVVYEQIRKKWKSQIDSAYKKIFTEDQWLLYLRNTGQLTKEQKKMLKKRKKGK